MHLVQIMCELFSHTSRILAIADHRVHGPHPVVLSVDGRQTVRVRIKPGLGLCVPVRIRAMVSGLGRG